MSRNKLCPYVSSWIFFPIITLSRLRFPRIGLGPNPTFPPPQDIPSPIPNGRVKRHEKQTYKRLRSVKQTWFGMRVFSI